MLLAGEGAGYIDYVISMINIGLVLVVVLGIILGIIGIIIMPKEKIINRKQGIVLGITYLVGLLLVPCLLGNITNDEAKRFVIDDAYHYRKYDDSGQCLKISGIYHFTSRDLYLIGKNAIMDHFIDYSENDDDISEYFNEQGDKTTNEYTGMFKGKNLIVVMMESMDDFLITPEDTPTLYKLMQEGINFTNFYTPDYATGYTFNTEYSFNTSSYPTTTGNISTELANNDYHYSLASLLKDEGYKCESYHYNSALFYNRGNIHQSFGFEKYNSYEDFPSLNEKNGLIYEDDCYLTQCEDLFNDFTDGDRFYSFNITYTAHLPYKYDDNDMYYQYIRNRFPEYDKLDASEEFKTLKCKARFTDLMFEDLLVKLDEKGILEDTVIVGFTDHYTYGLGDDVVHSLYDNPNEILERTPAFIYCKGYEGMQVEKTCQTIDLGVTLMNLFDVDPKVEVMGKDILDPNYEGYAIFPNDMWIYQGNYYRDGKLITGSMSESEIKEFNAFADKFRIINDEIVRGDYYSRH